MLRPRVSSNQSSDEMSKAFTRESDDLPDAPVVARQRSPLPPGAKNYLTPDGERRLRQELEQLVQVERPRLVASIDSPEAKHQLQVLGQRIDYLQRSFECAVVVPPANVPGAGVRFGANVTVRDSSGSESRYRIVGVDETDIDKGWVSWLSPIAKALLNARLGERVRFELPSGQEELEILSISFA
jgi:transcription elongation factor GreB